MRKRIGSPGPRGIQVAIVVILLAGGSGLATETEFRSFGTVEARDQKTTGQTLLFVTSPYGFVHNKWTQSPLQDAVPKTISMPKGSTQPALNTVMVQEIPTEEIDFRALEGTSLAGRSFWTILGAILGGAIAGAIRKSRAGGVMIGALVFLGGAVMLFDSGTLSIYIDNAMEDAVIVEVEDVALSIPGRSQMGIKVKERTRLFATTNASTGEEIERFYLRAELERDRRGKKIRGYYIYNIAGKNRYQFLNTAYGPE